MKRRVFLGALSIPLLALAQSDRTVPSSPVDSVVLYIVPTDGFPEQVAATIARQLTTDTGLWVKASLWTPSGVSSPLPGTNQYPAEDYLPLGDALARQLGDASARTYFIVLTDRDINSRAQNFRFQYSLHRPMARTSVLSIARLLYRKDGTPASDAQIGKRMRVMLMRIVGEMKFGWQRTREPADLMFAPIMSIDDIDNIDLTRSIATRRAQGLMRP